MISNTINKNRRTAHCVEVAKLYCVCMYVSVIKAVRQIISGIMSRFLLQEDSSFLVNGGVLWRVFIIAIGS